MKNPDFATLATKPLRRINDIGEVSFLLQSFWRRRRLVGAILLAALLGAVALVMFATPIYRATALVLIDFRRLAPVGDDATGAGGRIDVSVVASQIELLRSEPVLTRAVRDLGLVRDPEFQRRRLRFFDRVLSAVSFWAGPDDPVDLERAAARQLSRQIEIRRIAISYVIELSVRSQNPEKAARITNAVARAYIEDQLQARYEATARANEWMQSRIIVLQQQASDAELAVLSFRARNGIVMIDGRLAEDVRLIDITTRLSEARIALAEREARLERVREVMKDDETVGSVIEENQIQAISALRQRTVAIRARIADYTLRFGANHVSVLASQRELADTRRALSEEVQRIEQTLVSEFEIAQSKVSGLEKIREQLALAINSQQEVLAQVRQLEVLSASLKQLYESFLQRQMSSLQEQSYPITEARLVGDAIAPVTPTYPRASVVVPVTLLLAFILAVLLSIILEIMQPRFRRGLEVEQALGAPFLGYVPAMKAMAGRHGGSDSPLNRASLSGLLRAYPAMTRAADMPRTEFAETIRRIRLHLDERASGQSGFVVGVTSVLPAEGKTTISANLGTFLARNGARVVMIDGDLRVSALSRALAPQGAKGLEEHLGGPPALSGVQYSNDDGTLTLIPAVSDGKPVASPDQLLRSEQFAKLIGELRNSFDYVIVDLPPLAPVVDVRAVVHLIDAFVLVVRWDTTPIQLVTDVLNSNESVRRKLLGCILNNADPRALRRDDYAGSYRLASHYLAGN